MRYKVQSGDTLSKIADFLLGDMSRWPEIARANNLKVPYTIEIGQILNVPEIVPLKTGGTASVSQQSTFAPNGAASRYLTAKTPFGLPPKVFGIPTNFILFGAAIFLILPLFLSRKKSPYKY